MLGCRDSCGWNRRRCRGKTHPSRTVVVGGSDATAPTALIPLNHLVLLGLQGVLGTRCRLTIAPLLVIDS